MSLLMDALKKAELAKRQGQAEGAGSAAEAGVQKGLALEPLLKPGSVESAASLPATGNAPAAADLPPLPSHLEELDAQFLAEAKQAATTRLKAQPSSVAAGPPLGDQPPTADKPARGAVPPVQPRLAPMEQDAPRQSAAQNLFAAKHVPKPPARKTFAVAIGALTVVSVCAIGGYFWWQLQPKTALVASRSPSAPTPSAVSAAPGTPPAPTTIATPSSVEPAGVPSAAVRQTTPEPSSQAGAFAAATARSRAQASRAISVPAATATDSPIRVTKAPLKVNPALIRGFDAFNRGDLALAQVEYERAQKSDPRNTDALHGLAAIALRQGRLDQAEWLYRQIAEADPQDAVALAALINSRGQMDPIATESRLKSLSAAQPELAAPYFSLGNLYARQGRWNDAQQAYFRAYTAEPDNPDILYNLAISLEHLRQNKLAAQYYSQAIAAAQTRPAGFDKAQAAARLQTLQP